MADPVEARRMEKEPKVTPRLEDARRNLRAWIGAIRGDGSCPDPDSAIAELEAAVAEAEADRVIRERVAAMSGPAGFWDVAEENAEHHIAKWWLLECLGVPTSPPRETSVAELRP